MSRLSASQRKQIISDYRNGIPNEDYRVIDRGDGTYQVRKRDSKFKKPKKVEPEPEPVKEEPKKEEPPKESNRMSNEELLRKLSTLLKVPEQEVEETPEEFEQEEEANEDVQKYIYQHATQRNPYARRPLKLY